MLRLAAPLIAVVVWLGLLFFPAGRAHAAAGTDKVASKDVKLEGKFEDWPKGVVELLNDPVRTDGWNGWFSEWPNDVSHYELPVKNTDEANALLEKLGKVEHKMCEVVLSRGKEPINLGWMTRLKEGNNTAMLFAIGNQRRLDEWYKRLKGGKFGAMEFLGPPIAVPPTLTIYVENAAIDLDKLKFPKNVKLTTGSTLQIFHTWNIRVDKPPLDPAAAAALLEKMTDDERKLMERLSKLAAEHEKQRTAE